ncbi:hypothetical protein [Brevundimonas sp.]|uniref:hypothetical protein n=1 Tax=Brevundimonas sp. TaxID=1871086 RepID=UPI002D5BB24E|nr:hypothetical protein [Brevundimonas sp.]HYC66614.1 hypothetical protein [Brevundimonas sp.]
MKRAILSLVAAALAGVATACSPAPPEQDKTGPQAAGDWTRPPVIQRVDRTGSTLVVSGVAQADGRVVLRSDDGAAFAASADSRGRFEIRLPAPAARLLLRPETQVGQDTAPSPDQLLILAGGQGPVVVLRPGGATRRLDAAPALGAVDSDGRMRLASGRVAQGTDRVEVRSDGETVQVAPDAAGGWSVMLAPHGGPDQIQVDGRDFVWPGEAPASAGLSVERLESGWRVRWPGPAGASQSTWLPDPAGP